ncbi:hypothetical protein F2Q70_00029936 [Brassica cretica]|uniref:DUF1204 domain-containing protein n=1 Tax=Brassica cretica TaxID=69181 RepID=A0A8S9FL45_BRACR|nr:hypothetical protein F2Q70_00029936 [Brassica cretica]
MRPTLDVSNLAFPDKFAESVRADTEAAACKNALVMEYETALQKAALDHKKAEETIKIKEAELEMVKKEKLDKSERSCVVAAATRRFEKFWKYITDQDEKEKKRLLHGTALGTLDALSLLETKGLSVPQQLKDLLTTKTKRAMDRMRQSRNHEKEKKRLLHGTALGTLDALSLLETKGLSVPQQLKDLLTTNEAKFREEVEGVSVEAITERDLSPSPPRKDLLLRMNHFGSTFGTVDSASEVAFRSPILRGESSIVAPDSAVASRLTAVVSEGRAVAPGSPVGPVSGVLSQRDPIDDREAQAVDP